MSELQDVPNIGQIPNDWTWVNFGKIVQWSRYGVTATADENGQFPMLRMNNIQNGKLDTSDVVYINLTADEFDKHKLCKGELLVNRTNSWDLVGKTALMESNTDMVCASYLVRFKLKESVVPEFVNYFFNSYIGQYHLQNLATKGVSQANINPTVLKKHFIVPMPPLWEQRKIARILGTWDEAIATTEQLIQALERRKKGLMQRLLTGQIRFREFENQPWRQVRLGDVFSERKERGFADLPLLSITGEQGIVYRDELDRRDTSNPDKSRYLRICPNDIGYNTMRMWQGVSALSAYEGIVSPAYTICVPNDSVEPTFMAYLFKLPEMINKFHRFSQGLVSDTLTLRYNNFAEIKTLIPTERKEQRRIASVLNSVSSSIDHYYEYIELLKTQKKGLMQRLLTGQVRVQPDKE